MAKSFFLVCNAHLDPVWQWQRQEGMAEAISTFRVAARFCEEYDGFVFNHNESVLYEWVEENEPALFEKIKKLVSLGKWHIMGGWYLQPDVILPDGESIIRQIEMGNKYFIEKFGIKPTTAVNFDSFGHSRGLVQILKKSGYDSYMFMRPYTIVPEHDFIWKGYDGSTIMAFNLIEGYGNNKGKLYERLENMAKLDKDGAILIPWGIGDHGGGPSEVDLQALAEFEKKHPDISIRQTTPEEYFAQLDGSKLKTVDKSMQHCMVGCYTSMVRIKQSHRRLENELKVCEKMLATSGINYDKSKLEEAKKALAFNEFHDVLPGSSTKIVEDDSLRLMEYGREIAAQLEAKAFFSLTKGQPECKRGEIPIIVYNPAPYETEKIIECEFSLEDQNWAEFENTVALVRDQEGNHLPSQMVQEAGMINLDWRKRVAFRTKLKPMSINRFDCELIVKDTPRWKVFNTNSFTFTNDKLEVEIDTSTGMISKYISNGKNMLRGGMSILAIADDEDPWGMNVSRFDTIIGKFELVSDKEANEINGYPNDEFKNVRIIEDGDVFTRVQATLKFSRSYAIITYTIPKQDECIDIKIKLLSNDVNVMYKLSFDTDIDGSFIGQQMFGREEMLNDGSEVFYQKWCALHNKEKALCVLNKGSYSGSAQGNVMNITLLRTPIYLAHPITDRQYARHDRNSDHIDIGERIFEYRLTSNFADIDSNSDIYNQDDYTLSFFPPGEEAPKDRATIEFSFEDQRLVLTRYMRDDEIKFRILNPTEDFVSSSFTVKDIHAQIELKPFEFKTFTIKDGSVVECNVI